MRVQAIRTPALVDELVERVLGWSGRVRVLVDGPPPAEPGVLADLLGEALRPRGRPVLRVSTADFPRPASVRFEHGRDDPDELLDGWLDVGGLMREVLAPGGPYARSGRSGCGWPTTRCWWWTVPCCSGGGCRPS